ncbi:MAG: 1,4-dihydroxy-2-naphthoate octaprenyltransferase [Thermodesulfobacteriota bacterium]
MSSGTLRAWYQASRPPFFVATLIPLALGGAVAYASGAWDALRWVLVLSACFLVHLSTNLSNDYFDFLAGGDSGDALGGSRVIQQKKLTPEQILGAVIFCYAAAFIIGLWIVWTSQVWWLVVFIGFAFFSSLFYTAPPIRYGYHGLGELFVGLNMGPIMVVGTAAAVTGHFLSRSLWLSIPVGTMVALILFYQSLSDIEDDRAIGKFTLAVRLGRKHAVWGFRAFVGAALASIVILVVAEQLHLLALSCLGTIPLAVSIDRMITKTADWKELHDRGGRVRIFYLVNGAIVVISAL